MVALNKQGSFGLADKPTFPAEPFIETDNRKKVSREQEIVWINIIKFGSLHIAGLYGVYLGITWQANWWTVALNVIVGRLAILGITAGAHRLWSHRAYRAKLPLRILLCIFQSMASQNSIYEWCRDHRLHHRFSETDADPHNATKGFFYAHMGWFLRKKHSQVKIKGKSTYMMDLEKDSVVMFQKRHLASMATFFCIIMPWYIPVYFGENSWTSFYITLARYVISLNVTFTINSFAHLFGNKPYDKFIYPGQNKVLSILTLGEGWHNYHHTFPWDYKAAELSAYKYNLTAAFIDFMAWIGWAYDLKTVPDKIIMQRVNRTGDGSHVRHGKCCIDKADIDNMDNGTQNGIWGWGDEAMSKEDKEIAVVSHREKDKRSNFENGGHSYDHGSEEEEKRTVWLWGWDDKDMTKEERENAVILKRLS